MPDDIWAVPQTGVLRLANQLAVYPGMLEQYGRRARTRSDHLKLLLECLDWKPVPTRGETLKELEQFLLDRAMEHDSPSLASLLMLTAKSRHKKAENVRRYFKPSPDAVAGLTSLLAPGDTRRGGQPVDPDHPDRPETAEPWS
ncbi:DUF4158 domain-containing protein [Nonomuraea maritima]|uniref:DUF4158 domain-containing protein n=1 Tax=Nonomuraea maritima TaxID=683260 RepID=UPI0037135277